jgi:hypothetical protein
VWRVKKMPLFDYRCECGNKEERIVKRDEMDSQQCSCGAYMHRLFPDSFRFELVYNNKTDMCDWQGNTSQYWNDVKKQKEKEGKLTMPVTENIS